MPRPASRADARGVKTGFRTVPLDLIEFAPGQPRRRAAEHLDDLVRSMSQHGLLQPVVLVGWPEALVGGHFRLVAGERRVRAARKLGWTEIGAIIMPPEGRGFVLSVIENIRRRGLTRDERRRAFRRIVGDVGGDKAAAASLLGVSMTTLYRTIADPDALRYANWSTRGVLRQLQGAATGMPAAKRRELAKAMRAAADRIERGRAASTN